MDNNKIILENKNYDDDDKLNFCKNFIIKHHTKKICRNENDNKIIDKNIYSDNKNNSDSDSDKKNYHHHQQHHQQYHHHHHHHYNCSSNICYCFNQNQNYSIKKMESRFYKFLARFSGRRRSLLQGFHKITSMFIFILIVVSIINVTEACSSRTTPKPRPPPTPAPRPNITFHTYKCPPNYAKWYCLNEATCFTVKIGDEILYNCECADGYMGPRCEYKDLDGSYLPTRPRVMLETASIASGATLALIFVLILCIILYLRWQQRQKIDTFSENGIGNGGGNDIEGIDTIDGMDGGDNGGNVIISASSSGRIMSYVKCEHLERRPFGPHHHYTIPMSATFKR